MSDILKDQGNSSLHDKTWQKRNSSLASLRSQRSGREAMRPKVPFRPSHTQHRQTKNP